MISSKKLSIIHTESSCGWGGQEIRILTEIQGMLRRGHQVTLICPVEAAIYRAADQYGVPVIPLPIARKNLSGLFALRHWLSQHSSKINILNTHSSTDSWLTALACRFLKHAPPIIRTRHVSSPVKKNWRTRWLYQTATQHIVTTGEALRQQLHHDNQFQLQRMTSIPTGIDLTQFKRAARVELGIADRPSLGIVSTLRNWKGHTYLLEAFASLAPRYPDWQLLIIGDGPQRHNLQKRISELGLEHRVYLVGNQENVPDWLNALTIFVLPSYGDEGVPQSILQAMACGLPVVSTPIGAIAEAVEPNKTGYLVPPKNSAALAAALEKLMLNPKLRQALGQRGLEKAQQEFGIESMLDKMEAVFYQYAKEAS